MNQNKHTALRWPHVLMALITFGCDDPEARSEDDSIVEVIAVADSKEAPAADMKLFQWSAMDDDVPAFVPTARVSDDVPCEEREAAITEFDRISQPPEVPTMLSGGPGWHYTTWPETGFRPYNPSGCGGTKYCVFGAGTWVRWAGTYGTCGSAPWDVFVHDTPCGSGWVRADALN